MADQVVSKVLNKGPNVKADPRLSKLFDEGKLYHLRLGFGDNRKNYYGTKSELDTIFKNRVTSGGARNVGLKPPTGFVTGQDMLQAARDKNIFVSKGRQASNFADKFNIPKTTLKGQMFYDISKLKNQKEVDKIQKAQVIAGSGTPEAKKKFFKGKSFESKKRAKALKKFGGVKEGPFQGTKKTNLSHMDDIFSQYITGSNLGYAPASINYKLGDKGGIDMKMRALYKKREKLLKQNPKDLVKQLEDINIKGAKLAGQSQGFKQFTFMDPITKKTSSFGGGRLRIDVFDEFPGMTERQIVDYIKNADPNDFDAQLKIKMFELNRKEVFKAANRISKKEQLEVCSLLSRGGLPGDCAAAINKDPVKAAQVFEQSTSDSPAMTKLKQASNGFLNFVRGPGPKTFGVGAAVGTAVGLVKAYRNDDPTTYLSNEDQQKSMLVDMATQPISIDVERPAILDYQLPALGGTLAASTALAAPSTIKASKSRSLGIERKPKGFVKTGLRVLGRGLGVAASPALLAPFAAGDIASQVAAGDTPEDIATNPFNYLYPAFADQTPKLTRGLSPTIQKVARLGLPRIALKGLSRLGIGGFAASAAIQGLGLLDD
tara:strand:- start:312 stop:2117 length:1806 start_codon:yes stop_codon:yes gene_type:complete